MGVKTYKEGRKGEGRMEGKRERKMWKVERKEERERRIQEDTVKRRKKKKEED